MSAKIIAIIGAGQAGLQLAIGLQQIGYMVKLYSDRNADQIRGEKIMSSQGMFNSALKFERELNIDFWKHKAPQNKIVTFTLIDPQKKNHILQWTGKTIHPYQSVDQRIKFSRWLEEFKCLGGEINIGEVNINIINNVAKSSDLTIVATGKS